MDKEIIFIGIIEEGFNKYTLNFLDRFLTKYGFDLVYKNSRGIINFYSNKLSQLVIINMNKKNLESYGIIGLEPDILLIDQLDEIGYNSGLFSKEFAKCKYYIINSDDENWTSLGLEDIEGIVVTYGFNLKSTITLSSYNIDSTTKANICLQRDLITIGGKKIEPFEFTLEIDCKMKDNIYPLIGVSALLLILGYKDENIKIIN